MVVRQPRGPIESGGVADIAAAVSRIREWGERRDWTGYDPYDALNSPLAPVLSLGTRLGRRLLTQTVKLSPINLRPLLLVKPERNAKAIALVASAYSRLAAAGDDSASEDVASLLRWLIANDHAEDKGLAWGYHFPVATRVFEYRRRTPNVIASSFAAQAMLDAVELLGEADFRDSTLAAVAYLQNELLTRGPDGTYFTYLRGESELVHNANLLAAAVLARAARVLGEPALLETVAECVATSVAGQREDGSWPYATGAGHGWVDNFHTAYVLQSLAECARVLPGLHGVLERGVAYWRRELFLDDGTPKYYADRLYPLDAHCYADAVETWVALGDIEQALRQAQLLVERMLDRRGYIDFQQWPYVKNRVPLIRWTTAPAFRALAGVLLLVERPRPSLLDAG